MPPHPLTNFEIQKYYQSEPKFNGVYSRNNLPKIKDRVYSINRDEFKSIGIYWLALYVNDNNGSTSYDVIYFDSFEVKHIPKEIKKKNRWKQKSNNKYRIESYNSIMCGYSCIGFNDFMLRRKSFLDYKNLFTPNK